MANTYGSENYNLFVKSRIEWLKNWRFQKYEYETRTYKNYQIILKNHIYDKGHNIIMSESVSLSVFSDNKLLYTCECIEDLPSTMPFTYTHNGNDYMFFRKSLYGYTILNLDTLEEYNYFPSNVSEIEHGEAYIIVTMSKLENYLAFNGCYWADLYECQLLDLNTKKVYRFREEIESFKNVDVDNVKTDNQMLSIKADDKVLTFTKEQIDKLFEKCDNYDI